MGHRHTRDAKRRRLSRSKSSRKRLARTWKRPVDHAALTRGTPVQAAPDSATKSSASAPSANSMTCCPILSRTEPTARRAAGGRAQGQGVDRRTVEDCDARRRAAGFHGGAAGRDQSEMTQMVLMTWVNLMLYLESNWAVGFVLKRIRPAQKPRGNYRVKQSNRIRFPWVRSLRGPYHPCELRSDV